MNYLKYLPAILFILPITLTVRLLGILAGVFSIPAIIYAEYKKDDKLPKLFYLWDNMEDGYHGCKRGVVNWFTYRRDSTSFWGRVKKSIYWSVIRNPFNNGSRLMGIPVKDIQEIEEKGNFENIVHIHEEVKSKGTITSFVGAKYKKIWFPQLRVIKQVGKDTFFDFQIGWKLGIWLDTHRHKYLEEKDRRYFTVRFQVRNNSTYMEKFNG